MSSTNRSNARDKHKLDYYITPIACIEKFLSAFDEEVTLNFEDRIILDPCAGGDSKHPMSYPSAIRKYFSIPDEWDMIRTLDIRKDSLAERKCDYLVENIDYKPFLIFTNPPFVKAMEFVNKALNDVADDGYVIMLLRLNFLETKARKDFFDNYMPSYIYVHHKRISFTEDGKTDSCAYCHMVWKKNDYPQFAKIKVI